MLVSSFQFPIVGGTNGPHDVSSLRAQLLLRRPTCALGWSGSCFELPTPIVPKTVGSTEIALFQLLREWSGYFTNSWETSQQGCFHYFLVTPKLRKHAIFSSTALLDSVLFVIPKLGNGFL
jgi:hypothetical protein